MSDFIRNISCILRIYTKLVVAILDIAVLVLRSLGGFLGGVVLFNTGSSYVNDISLPD